MAENSTVEKKAQNKYEIGRARINSDWRLNSRILELNEFESIIEAGSDWLNFFFCGKMGLFLGDRLYSGAQLFDSHTVCEIPVLNIVVMYLYHIELFWLVGEAFGDDVVFAHLFFAFTSFEYVAGLNRVRILTV